MSDQIYIAPSQAFVDNARDILFSYNGVDAVEINWTGSADAGGYYEVSFRRSDADAWERTEIAFAPHLVINYPFEEARSYEFKFVTFLGSGRYTVPDFIAYVIPTPEAAPQDITVTRETVVSARMLFNDMQTGETYLVAFGPYEERVRLSKYDVIRVTDKDILIQGLTPGVLYRFVVNKVYKEAFLPYAKVLIA